MKEKIRDKGGYEIGGFSNIASAPPEFIENQNEILANFKANPEQRIWVKSNYQQKPDGGDIVALYEKNEAHQNGEAFVAGANPTEVALTEKVVNALNEGWILPATQDEVQAFQQKSLEQQRNYVESRKQVFLDKFIELTGSDENFEDAWKLIKARESLESVAKGF